MNTHTHTQKSFDSKESKRPANSRNPSCITVCTGADVFVVCVRHKDVRHKAFVPCVIKCVIMAHLRHKLLFPCSSPPPTLRGEEKRKRAARAALREEMEAWATARAIWLFFM